MINEADVKYFRPFWKTITDKTNKNIYNSEDYTKNPIWMEDENRKDINNIYDRFELIFGKDASIGTMSALVTLKCIPNEVIGSGNMKNFYESVLNIDVEKDVEKKKEIRAALTIAIFMRMLDKNLWKKEKSERDKYTEVSRFGALDGYLYYYLMNAPAAYYGEIDKNLFLFAHGGITQNFLDKGGQINKKTIVGWDETVKNKQGSKKYWEEEKAKRKAEKAAKEEKGGGGDKEGGEIQIQFQIQKYNKECHDLLQNFFNKVSISKKISKNLKEELHMWVGPMLSLLNLSAGTKTNPNQKKDPSNENLDTYAGNYEKLFNVFGHASVSSCYTLGKAKESTKTYFINTDFSTTLFKADIACDDNYNNNYLLLILDPIGENGLKLTCEGKIFLNTDYQLKNDEPYTIKNIDTVHDENKPGKPGKPELIAQNLIAPQSIAPEFINPIVFDSEQNLIDIIDEVNYMNQTNNFCFNGMVKIGEIKYLMLSSKYSKVKTSIALIPYNVAVAEDAAAVAEDAAAGGRKQRASKYKVKRKTKRNRKTKRISKSKGTSNSKGKKGRKTKKGGRKTRRKRSN